MPARIVEWQLPYTWGTGIEIDTNKVISILLREENNLIMVNSDNEVYTDLQLQSGLTPSSDFPVWVTTGKVLQSDWWEKSGLILNWKTTSGDYARWIYATDWKIYFDNGTGTWNQVYYSSEVDNLLLSLRQYVDSELAKKQNWVTSVTAPANPVQWDLWYDTNYDILKVFNWSQWVVTWWWGGTWDVVWPNSSVDGNIAIFDWTTWKIIKDGNISLSTLNNKVDTNTTNIWTNTNDIATINWKIPSAATTSNQLADKAYVNDSINSITAYYITKNAQGDQFATYAELAAATTFYSGGVVRVPTRNDYCIVLDDENHDHACTRYIYQNNQWEFQYIVNETALTQAQLNALNSWITSGKVSTYDGYASTIAWKQDTLVSWTNIKTVNSNSLLWSWDITLNDVKVSATAPSSPTEWMVWYDTTNDQLKVYDGTNWNVTGKEYNAGEWIEIKNWPDYSAMQWPAPDGFHVPLSSEWQWLKTITDWFSLTWDWYRINLHMPFTGRRITSSSTNNQGNYGYYWSSSPYDSEYPYNASSLILTSSNISTNSSGNRAAGYSVRCFKNSFMTPTSSWTVITWTLWGAWIFRNQIEWLISITSDWVTWYTIQDKNLWATTVYNDGDTLSEANCWKYYQWGNNYWFSRTWTVTTSSTQVDASNYWPWNYYSSSTFITWSTDRSSVHNDNLWGAITWVVTLDNAITNTGVLSVNWQTGNVTIAAWLQVAPNSPITWIKYIWYGTEAQYAALTQYYTDTPWDTEFRCF